MKKIVFLSLFSLIGFFGTAQLNVGNSTPTPLMVTVKFASGPGSCIATTSQTWLIAPGNVHLFSPTGPAMVAISVAATSGPASSDSDGVPCVCPSPTGGVFFFDWSPDCTHVKIKP